MCVIGTAYSGGARAGPFRAPENLINSALLIKQNSGFFYGYIRIFPRRPRLPSPSNSCYRPAHFELKGYRAEKNNKPQGGSPDEIFFIDN